MAFGLALSRCAGGKLSLAILIACTLTLVGCTGGSGAKLVDIDGRVTLDGVPIANGTITCIPRATNASKGSSAPIANGNFQLRDVPIGENIFTFTASIETERTITGPGGGAEPERVNPIPAHYRTEGIVRAIADGGDEDFALTTK